MVSPLFCAICCCCWLAMSDIHARRWSHLPDAIRLQCHQPNLHGDPSGLIHYTKPGLIGQVIPKKTGVRPRKGGVAINAAIAAPLLIPFGLSSTTHLPGCSASSGCACAPGGERKHGLFMLRCGDSARQRPSLWLPAPCPAVQPVQQRAAPAAFD